MSSLSGTESLHAIDDVSLQNIMITLHGPKSLYEMESFTQTHILGHKLTLALVY